MGQEKAGLKKNRTSSHNPARVVFIRARYQKEYFRLFTILKWGYVHSFATLKFLHNFWKYSIYDISKTIDSIIAFSKLPIILVRGFLTVTGRLLTTSKQKWQEFEQNVEKITYVILKRSWLFCHPRYRLQKRRPMVIKFKLPKIHFIFPRLVFTSFILFILSSSVFFYLYILKNLPNPHELITRPQVLTTKIYARDGSLLYKIYRNQNRTLITLDQLPPHLINATIAAEDKNFWKHPGFSAQGIIRAFKTNISDDALSQGGSTITQQLVKNALLSSEKTFTRKLKEVILAIEVELMFNKNEILQMYLNEIPYGGVAYGVEEAAQSYFGKSAKDLNIAEAALLSGLPVAPTKYSPFGANPSWAVYRQRQVLKSMLDAQYISLHEYNEALKAKIILNPPKYDIKSPHFVMYVKDILVETYGTRTVEEGGLEVLTSLDPLIQQNTEQAVITELDNLKNMNVTNGAAVVTNPNTGEILAMAGSRDYFDTQRDGNVNVTLMLRQPGSSIKPLTYALALQSGMTPLSIIDDTPVSYPDGNRPYVPVNYDGRFHGRVTLKTALGSSYNIPAVKLLNKLGVDSLYNFGKTMGITTWKERNRFGLSLTLGGGEVKMIDMAVAYGVFANNGVRMNLNPILQVRDSNGKLLQQYDCPSTNILAIEQPVEAAGKTMVNCRSERVLSPLITYQISDMLSDNTARIPAFGPNSLLNIPNQQIPVKTGTTNDRRDNWTIGYTPDRVVVVWVGNNDNSPMSAVTSGITGATPIWRTITDSLIRDKEPIVLKAPAGLKAVEVCSDNGYLPCSSCRNIKTEYFIPGTEPKQRCLDKPQEEQNNVANVGWN